jgi:hypothetical protein
MHNIPFNPALEKKKELINSFADHQAEITNLVQEENQELEKLVNAVEKNLQQAQQKN